MNNNNSLTVWVNEWDNTEHDNMSVSATYDWICPRFLFQVKPKRNMDTQHVYTFSADTMNTAKPPVGFSCDGYPIYPPLFESKEQLDKHVSQQIAYAKHVFKTKGIL